MTPIELKDYLSDLYDLVAFVDLADLRGQHRSIFDLFRTCRRDRFEPDQRLVLYSCHDPEQELADHVQRAASRTDISNYFILWVCPHDITKKLSAANDQFGYDDSIMPSMILDVVDTSPFGSRGYVTSKSLCPLPFAMAIVGPAGEISPCCKFKGTLGTLADSDLDQVYHNDRAQSIRNQMIRGEYPAGCTVCWQNEGAGTTSFRQHALDKYQDRLDQEWLDDIRIRDLSWTPTALCNLACRICNATVSSARAVEDINFATDSRRKKDLQHLLSIKVSEPFTDDIMRALDQDSAVEFLHILGGEPLIWPSFTRLIDQLIQSGKSKSMQLEINTNCTVRPDRDLFDRIRTNFQSVEFLLSVDNIGRRFEIERGGRWDQVVDNINQFRDLRSPTVQVKLVVTINLQNLLYLDDVIDFAHGMGLPILWWYLEAPEYFCIDRATSSVKKLVHARYHDHADPELRRLATRVSQAQGSNGERFIQHVRQFDDRRHQQFAETHAEIYQAMSDCSS